MSQQTMFDSQPARAPTVATPATRPETSRAARDVAVASSRNRKSQILAFIVGRGWFGATIDEISEALDILTATVCPLRLDLEREGKIVDSGRRRDTRHGRPAAVWIGAGIPQRGPAAAASRRAPATPAATSAPAARTAAPAPTRSAGSSACPTCGRLKNPPMSVLLVCRCDRETTSEPAR